MCVVTAFHKVIWRQENWPIGENGKKEQPAELKKTPLRKRKEEKAVDNEGLEPSNKRIKKY